MGKSWVTPGSTRVESVINPVNAACEQDFVPETLYLLENPGITGLVDEIAELAETVVTEYGQDNFELVRKTRDEETDFDAIQRQTKEAIEETKRMGGEVAVDVTPGRKFMSAITFQSGVTYGADHVYYLFIESEEYFGKTFPEIPRPARRLYDFREEVP